jgi:hypothetical protein
MSLIFTAASYMLGFKQVKLLGKEVEYDDVVTFTFEKDSVSYIAGQYTHILVG